MIPMYLLNAGPYHARKQEKKKVGGVDELVRASNGCFSTIGGPHNKDYSILGSALGSPHLEKLPNTVLLLKVWELGRKSLELKNRG